MRLTRDVLTKAEEEEIGQGVHEEQQEMLHIR